MAKFFKILMNIILILFIAALCAVFIPPFFGISVNAASPNVETNMSIGSAAYGVKESLSDINAGDNIIVNDSDSVYLYEVAEVNADNGELTVRKSSNSDTEVIELRRTASKVVIVIPLIGYILIALQSFEGLIILGLAVALVIILFIISRVIAKNHDEEDNGSASDKEDDFGYFKELAASTDRPSSLDALATMSMASISDEAAEPVNTVPTDTIALDEEIEDLSELVLEPADNNEHDNISDEVTKLSSEIENETEKKADDEAISGNADTSESEPTIVETSSEETSEETSEFSSLEGALEQVLSTNQINQTPEDVVPNAVSAGEQTANEETSTEIELAIPSHSLDELLQEAYAKGEDPQVKKDSATGITLVDYSSCL